MRKSIELRVHEEEPEDYIHELGLPMRAITEGASPLIGSHFLASLRVYVAQLRDQDALDCAVLKHLDLLNNFRATLARNAFLLCHWGSVIPLSRVVRHKGMFYRAKDFLQPYEYWSERIESSPGEGHCAGCLQYDFPFTYDTYYSWSRQEDVIYCSDRTLEPQRLLKSFCDCLDISKQGQILLDKPKLLRLLDDKSFLIFPSRFSMYQEWLSLSFAALKSEMRTKILNEMNSVLRADTSN